MVELTIEEIKKELKEYYGNQQIINTYEKNNGRIEDLYDNATRATSILSDMPKGNSDVMDSKVAGNVAEIVDIKIENRKIEDTNNLTLIGMKHQNLVTYSTILQLENPYKNILYYRYIENVSFTKIANIIGKEYKWCCKLHSKALYKYLNLRQKNSIKNKL
jgi:DNA-directed RNA polymerase specialized sigma subunit